MPDRTAAVRGSNQHEPTACGHPQTASAPATAKLTDQVLLITALDEDANGAQFVQIGRRRLEACEAQLWFHSCASKITLEN
jgi:hypothetical protein